MAAEEVPTKAGPRELSRRLFFALWPDGAMRAAMAHATRKAGLAAGRPVPAANLHVTLVFLGSVPERRLAELGAIARASGAASAERLELAFDHLEYWRAAQLLCALPAECPAPMAALARNLQDRLAACGFAPDLKGSLSVGVSVPRQFRPHVTVARKVHRPPGVMEMQPVIWGFGDLVLVESKTLPEGSVYTVLETIRLSSGVRSEKQ